MLVRSINLSKNCLKLSKKLKMQKILSNLQFQQYPSIELATRDKYINIIRSEGYDKPQIVWVASQKIHGSNFSIHYSGKDKIARYGRRNDFLSKQIPVPCEDPSEYFTEAFYDAKNTVKKTHDHLEHVFEKIKQKHPYVETIQIYGQYFGGNWPQKVQKSAKAVQKGVYYTPYHQFMAFDIKVITPNLDYWVDVLDIPEYLDGKFMHVPVYAKGTFQQIYAINSVIDSTIPQLLGLKKIQQNIIEGFVLRPNKNIIAQQFDMRIILKKKNKQFEEKASGPTKQGKEKKQAVLDPEVAPFVEFLAPYVNFNRIESVTSKFPDLKDRRKLKDEVAKDSLSDAVKDQYKEPEQKQLAKKVKIQFEKIVMKQINNYYVKH